MTRNQNDVLRESIHCCTICALRGIIIGEVEVNHIDGNHDNDNKDNLIVLCRSCHAKAEIDRNPITTLFRKWSQNDLKFYRNKWNKKCEALGTTMRIKEGENTETILEEIKLLRNDVELIKNNINGLKNPNLEPPELEKRVDIKIEGLFMGEKDAPIEMIEFVDFECPFSANFATFTLKDIITEYVETGKVKFAVKHFPLQFHQLAKGYAQLAEYAKTEDKFWEFYNKIFESLRDGKFTSIESIAINLDLNLREFYEFVAKNKGVKTIDNDIKDGYTYNVSGTPSFFINGKYVIGAQPFDVFKQIIDEELRNLGEY